MTYVARDGTLGGRKSIGRQITDFFQGIVNFIALFFSAVTNPPQRIESQATVRKNCCIVGGVLFCFVDGLTHSRGLVFFVHC